VAMTLIDGSVILLIWRCNQHVTTIYFQGNFACTPHLLMQFCVAKLIH